MADADGLPPPPPPPPTHGGGVRAALHATGNTALSVMIALLSAVQTLTEHGVVAVAFSAAVRVFGQAEHLDACNAVLMLLVADPRNFIAQVDAIVAVAAEWGVGDQARAICADLAQTALDALKRGAGRVGVTPGVGSGAGGTGSGGGGGGGGGGDGGGRRRPRDAEDDVEDWGYVQAPPRMRDPSAARPAAAPAAAPPPQPAGTGHRVVVNEATLIGLHQACTERGTLTCEVLRFAVIVATLLVNPVANCAAAFQIRFEDDATTSMGRFVLRVVNLWGVDSLRLPACLLTGETIDAVREVRARARGHHVFLDMTAKTLVRLLPGGPWRTMAELCGARAAPDRPLPAAAAPVVAARPAPVVAARAAAPPAAAPDAVPAAAAAGAPRLLAPPKRPVPPPSPLPAKAYLAPSPPTPSEVPSAPSPAALDPAVEDVADG